MTDNATIDVALTRVFDAPRELVYRAFTDPDQLARWYGPAGFSVPRDTVDVDARAGGHLRLVMVSDTDPDLRSAVDLHVTKVIENQLLVGTEDWEGVPGQQGAWSIHRRLEFHDHNGKARLVLREGPPPGDGGPGPPGVEDHVPQARRPPGRLNRPPTWAFPRWRSLWLRPPRCRMDCRISPAAP